MGDGFHRLADVARPLLRSRRVRNGVLGVIAAICGCTGSIGEPGDPPFRDDPPPPEGEVLLEPRRLVFLHARHWSNSVADLLGLDAVPVPSSSGGSAEGFFHGGATRMSEPIALELQRIAEESAVRATGDLPALTGCTDENDACLRAAIERIAVRAFRRPLRDDERTGLNEVYDAGRAEPGTPREGVQWAIEAILQAPSFLYRREIGVADAGAYRLDGWEIATALSYMLRDASLDQPLADAAASGALDGPDGIAAEVDRLLDDPLVQARVVELYARLFEVARISHAEHTDGEWNDSLRIGAGDELHRLLDDHLFGEGDRTLATLLTTRQGYVNDQLAGLYGVTPPADSTTPVLLPPVRAGILSRVAFLAGFSDVDETSVVRRGLFVSRSLLCAEIPAPPPGVLEAAADDLAMLSTERERADYRADQMSCSACHARIDPFGLAFEGYDAIGRARSEDATAVITAPPSVAGAVEGAIALEERLAASPEVRECIARQVAGYAVGRAFAAAEAETVAEIAAAFETGGDLTALFGAVARSDVFRFRGEASP
jgi:hypothetical protein